MPSLSIGTVSGKCERITVTEDGGGIDWRGRARGEIGRSPNPGRCLAVGAAMDTAFS